jgi:putative heme-binding domain-containing protein
MGVTRLGGAAAFVAAMLQCVVAFAAQEHAGQFSPVDVETGYGLYNVNCITCHGPNGDQVEAVNLASGRFRHASSDADLTNLIQTGIPGTAMPAGRYTTAELAGLVAYLRAMHDFAAEPARGDAARGRTLFEGKGNCASCHRVNGSGSRAAPDLTDIGAVRTADALRRSLVTPGESIAPINRPIRAVTRDGTVITGRRLNEDTYTVQLITPDERLLSLVKADLREFAILTTSTMPSYANTLGPADLDDLVAYLRTLKGFRQAEQK